jgi:hypothetical protein
VLHTINNSSGPADRYSLLTRQLAQTDAFGNALRGNPGGHQKLLTDTVGRFLCEVESDSIEFASIAL